MKKLEDYSKKELLKLPKRKWNDDTRLYDKIWIVPAGLKHDSGYMCIAIIGVWKEGEETKAEICAYPDDISYFFPFESGKYSIAKVRQDCFYPTGVLQFHSRNGKFYVSEALSSVDIKLVEMKL
jgi:hypothetical protein